jgi:hypothetical protein
VTAGIEQLFTSLTAREVNDYKQFSKNSGNLLTSAGDRFRQGKRKKRTAPGRIS